MKKTQLPLIEELSLDHLEGSTSSRPSRKFIAPSTLPLALALLALLSGPTPLEQLQQIAGAEDSAVLIADLRQLGVALHCHDVPVFDDYSEISSCTVCALSVTDGHRIQRWIKTSGGGHA
jgi:hypothetical protein